MAIERIRGVVDKLCAPECAGRETGSPEGEEARRWIAEQFEAIGLAPTAPGFVQPLPDIGGGNVIGHLDGASERVILVAAHYDHLGLAEGGDAYWGADDNAAAVAILLEVARALVGRELGRKVLFCAFDAEEPPHFLGHTMGSQRFVAEPLVPLDAIDLMICMDLMGHALGPARLPDGVRQTVFALGAETSAGTAEIIDGLATQVPGVVVRRLGGDVVPPLSDYHAFAENGVPYVFLTCGRWSHYHQTTDTPEKLDYPKIAASAAFLTNLVVALTEREGRPRSTAVAGTTPRASGRCGTSPISPPRSCPTPWRSPSRSSPRSRKPSPSTASSGTRDAGSCRRWCRCSSRSSSERQASVRRRGPPLRRRRSSRAPRGGAGPRDPGPRRT